MKTALTILFLIVSISFIGVKAEQNFYPSNILLLSNYFSNYIFVAEKSSHKLYLYRNDSGNPTLVKTYPMATGKIKGDKWRSGDRKTPEGIYNFQKFLPAKELLRRYGKEGEIYGSGAFTMDYPNPIDHMEKKTGGGIWLHSTNDESRIQKGLDSRGCIVVSNIHLKEISTYMSLQRTPVVVVEKIHYLKKELWERDRNQIQEFINTWEDAWEQENISDYISHYDPKKFHSPTHGNLKRYKAYKSAVFRGNGKPNLEISHLTILRENNYVKVSFAQHYQSNRLNDVGEKTLYLSQDKNLN